MKIRPVEVELFHADGRTDGQTDMTKIIVFFEIFRRSVKFETFNINSILPLSEVNIFH
jgi:hypothetical protein